MREMTRRLFIKSAVAIAAIGSLGKYFFGRYTEPRKGGIMGSVAKGRMGIPVVSERRQNRLVSVLEMLSTSTPTPQAVSAPSMC